MPAVRSSTASNFVAGTTCVEQNEGSDTIASDATAPPSGAVFYYLVRAENVCPFVGVGPLGPNSASVQRASRTCP